MAFPTGKTTSTMSTSRMVNSYQKGGTTMRCAHCNSEMGDRYWKGRTYCSRACHMAHEAAQVKNCKKCGTEFHPSNGRQIYCSNHCRETTNNNKDSHRKSLAKAPINLEKLAGWTVFTCTQCGKSYYSVDDTPRKCYICNEVK